MSTGSAAMNTQSSSSANCTTDGADLELIVKPGTIPSVEDFMRLRLVSGLSPRSVEGAAKGLPNSLFAVIVVAKNGKMKSVSRDPETGVCTSEEIKDGSEAPVVAMARVVGDGGLNFEVVDVAVDPLYQRRGLGRMLSTGYKHYKNSIECKLMNEVMKYLKENAPEKSYMTLVADVPQLYEKFGFKDVRCEESKCEGMYLNQADLVNL